MIEVNVGAAEELYALIRSRRSIRRYTPAAIPSATIERLLQAATWAPSAHNRQPWRFSVLHTPEVKARLAQAMGARLRADRLGDGDAPDEIARDVARSYARITSAPTVVVVCLSLAEMDSYSDARRANAEQAMAVQSTAMAVQNLLLAAHAEGLGACWMCAPLFCPAAVVSALDLPPDWQPQALITLGQPAQPGKPAVRRPLTDVIVERA